MKTSIYTLFLSLLLMNCSKKEAIAKAEMKAENPFNTQLNQLIEYAKVTGDDIVDYVNVTIQNANIKHYLHNLKNSQILLIIKSWKVIENCLLMILLKISSCLG